MTYNCSCWDSTGRATLTWWVRVRQYINMFKVMSHSIDFTLWNSIVSLIKHYSLVTRNLYHYFEMLPFVEIQNQTVRYICTVDKCSSPAAVQTGHNNHFAVAVWDVQLVFFWVNSKPIHMSICRYHKTSVSHYNTSSCL